MQDWTDEKYHSSTEVLVLKMGANFVTVASDPSKSKTKLHLFYKNSTFDIKYNSLNLKRGQRL